LATTSILVLDADSVAGLAVVQSLGAAGYRCILGATRDDAPAFASRYAAGKALYPDPLADVEAFKEWLRGWLRGHEVALIIPTTECTLAPLAAMRDEAEVVGRAALHPAAALETALDKEKLRRLAAELGVPTPASAYVQRIEELDDARIAGWLAQGGVVVKATVSKAWNAGRAFEFPTKVAADAVELRRLVAARVAHVPVQVQEWVPGHGVGIEVLAHRGDIALHIAHERIHEVPLTGGGSSYRRTIAAPAGPYGDAALLSRALGLHGVAMVEFRFDPASGNHWLMEINMRFWGSLHLGAFAGADFPRALADMLLHDRVLPQPEVRLGVTARNVSRDVEWLKLVRKRRGNATRFELTRRPRNLGRGTPDRPGPARPRADAPGTQGSHHRRRQIDPRPRLEPRSQVDGSAPPRVRRRQAGAGPLPRQYLPQPVRRRPLGRADGLWPRDPVRRLLPAGGPPDAGRRPDGRPPARRRLIRPPLPPRQRGRPRLGRRDHPDGPPQLRVLARDRQESP
jgi:predicted ATP-grasp superfamily ATP-dependent carboligase